MNNGEKDRLQRFYEQIGAPVLLHRNKPGLFDERYDPGVDAKVFADTLKRQRRTQARWYYPIDYHAIKPCLPEFPPDIKFRNAQTLSSQNESRAHMLFTDGNDYLPFEPSNELKVPPDFPRSGPAGLGGICVGECHIPRLMLVPVCLPL
jgi:hypothetical protein